MNHEGRTARPQADLAPWLGGDADVYAVGVQEARYSTEGAPMLHPSPRCTPHHATPLAMLPPPHHAAPLALLHAARPHRAAPLARLPTPCQASFKPNPHQASFKLPKELHDTHKSCTEHWLALATQACAGGGLHQVGLVSMDQTRMLPISPYISLYLPVPAYLPTPHQVGLVSMGQIHLLVLCKQAIAEFVSEVETGSVSLGDRLQPDRHQPATSLATARTPPRHSAHPPHTLPIPSPYPPHTLSIPSPYPPHTLPIPSPYPPQVPTGVGGVGTNKGGVAVSFRVCASHVCFVNAHLAAHEGELHVRQRNANAADISQHLSVGKVRASLAQP